MIKKVWASIALLCFSFTSNAQCLDANKNIYWCKDKLNKMTTQWCEQLGVCFPIYRVYPFTDISGEYICVLTENDYDIAVNKSKKIAGFLFKVNQKSYSKIWEINDFVLPELEESAIWFWTKYAFFKDLDNDGLIEPILCYGTFGPNGYDDGRMKLFVYYKGQKIGIRHQNGVLDDERKTQIDSAFYKLPKGIQKHIKETMKTMKSKNHCLFDSKDIN